MKNKCKKCGGECKKSKALLNSLVSSNDFGNDAGERGTTVSRIGRPKLVECLKCVNCGHSFIADIDFESITIRQKVTSRGGGIEISLDKLGYKNERMTTYQNYLGGGLLGRIESDCTIKDWRSDEKLLSISEQLKEYFHNLTNPESEWESMSYKQNQNIPISSY